MFSEYNYMKIRNKKQKYDKITNFWKGNNTLLNNQWVKE